MNILIAMNSFKNSLSSKNACLAVKEAIEQVSNKNNLKVFPICDGGEGTGEILNIGLRGKKIVTTVPGPVFNKINSSYIYDEKSKTAIIEIAQVIGLDLINIKKISPLETTSYGVGKLIIKAIKKGAKKIVIGVGGTCTNDGGMGLLSALGVKFLDKENKPLLGIGKDLIKVHKIDMNKLNPLLENVEFVIANDVTNKLYGKYGAACVYAKQKGASDEEIIYLDNGLKNYAQIINNELKTNVEKIKGGGSGGGIGMALMVFLNAKMESGYKLMAKFLHLDKAIKEADLVITGEGKVDEQTLKGKGPYGIATTAKKYQKKVIVFCGINTIKNPVKQFDMIYSLIDEKTSVTDDVLNNGFNNLKSLVIKVFLKNKN